MATNSPSERESHSGSITPDQLRDALAEKYLEFVCGMTSLDLIEGYRRYQTDVKFKQGVDLLVNVALDAIGTLGGVEQIDLDLFAAREQSKAHHPAGWDMGVAWKAFQEGVLGEYE